MRATRTGYDQTTTGVLRWWRAFSRAGSGSKPILIPAVVTCFVAVAGTWMTDRYQTTAWVRERQFEIFKQNFEGGLALVDDLAEHMGTRFIGLNRVIWAVKEQAPRGPQNLDEAWDEYYDSVVAWNAKLLRYKGQLSRFIGTGVAETFCSREDYRLSYSKGDPQSIHGMFLVAHQHVRALMECAQMNCASEARQSALREANQSVNLLGIMVEDFINTATQKVYERAEQGRSGAQTHSTDTTR